MRSTSWSAGMDMWDTPESIWRSTAAGSLLSQEREEHNHIGKGMMHCWGAMEFVPEAKAVRREYFAALR